MSRPSRTSRAPPMMLMTRMWRLSQATEPVTQPRPRATSRNGMPRPRQYATAEQRTARGVAASNASVFTAMSVGPRHGVHPSANTMPSSGAPAIPVATFHCGLIVRCRKLTCPMNTMPITMSTTPATRRITSSHDFSSSPAVPNSTPISTNTMLNPRMNSTTPSSSRRRPPGSPESKPPMYPRYPGTSGSTHGDANEISPAAIAIGTATSRLPSRTSSPTGIAATAPRARGRSSRRGWTGRG